MDRRGFLRTTFVTGLAASSGCAADMVERAAKAPLDDDALERKMARLQRTLVRMDSRFAQEWFLEQRIADLDDPWASERLQADGELLRTSLRIATAVSVLAELPESNRSDPRVTSPIAALIGEADYAVFGTQARLDALDEASLAALDREAADDPRFVERVSEQVESLADSLGVAASQRLHLRAMTKQVGWRLQRESFSAVVADTRAKLDDALAGAHRRIVDAASLGSSGSPGSPIIVVDPAWVERTRAAVEFESQSVAIASAEAELAKSERKRNIFLGTGAAMVVVGGGLVVGGIYLVLFDAGATITVGGIGVTTGIILLILGIIMAVRVRQQRERLELLQGATPASDHAGTSIEPSR